MAQPPDYGSYAKKDTKVFKLSRFIKNAVLVTIILAVVEVVVIYFVMNKKHVKKQVAATTIITEPKIQTAPIILDTIISALADTNTHYQPPDTKATPNPTIIDTPKIIVPVKKDTIATQPTVTSLVTKTSVDTAKILPEAKLLSAGKMKSIMESIKKQKSKLNISSNCIQIRKTNASNVTNAFKIAEYLKKNGFIIGGRLTVGGNVKGYKVNMNESCIELTIGTM